MRSGEVAAAAGVSTDTLRHYERKGLLETAARAPNGYRDYPASAVARVRLIQRALAVGFSLEELARVLQERARGGAPCQNVRALVGSRLKSVEAQLRDLRRFKRDLELILADWDARLARTAKGERAHLLEGLTSVTAPVPASGRRRGILRGET